VLATLAQRWRAELAAGQRVAMKPMITLRTRYGMRMVLERRGQGPRAMGQGKERQAAYGRLLIR